MTTMLIAIGKRMTTMLMVMTIMPRMSMFRSAGSLLRSCLKNCIVILSTYFATNDDVEYDNDHDDDDDDVDLDDNDVVKASGV